MESPAAVPPRPFVTATVPNERTKKPRSAIDIGERGVWAVGRLFDGLEGGRAGKASGYFTRLSASHHSPRRAMLP